MLYGEDLAYIHDSGFGGFASEASDWLLEFFRHHGLSGERVVDLGCGSGIWAAKLLTAGYEVTGVDVSSAMIELARRRAPEVRFLQSSLSDFRFPRCDVVTALGECLSYITVEGPAVPSFTSFFETIYERLSPGGLLILDVLENERCRSGYRLGNDWAVLLDVSVDRDLREVTRRITSFRKVGSGYRRSDEIHTLSLLKVSELSAKARGAGFRVSRVRGYGKVRFRKGQVGLICRKGKKAR